MSLIEAVTMTIWSVLGTIRHSFATEIAVRMLSPDAVQYCIIWLISALGYKRTSTNRRIIMVSRPRAWIEGAWFSAQFSTQQLVSTLLYRC